MRCALQPLILAYSRGSPHLRGWSVGLCKDCARIVHAGRLVLILVLRIGLGWVGTLVLILLRLCGLAQHSRGFAGDQLNLPNRGYIRGLAVDFPEHFMALDAEGT